MSFLFCFFAFLSGSIPWGYLIGRSKGIDLRKAGSCNIGATNVMRVIGKKEALLTLTLDILKGFMPVFVLRLIPLYGQNLILLAVAGIFAIVGHCFTPFLKFKGGKGVATSTGVVLAIMPWAGLITVLLWAVTVKISRISSLGAVVSFSLLPVTVYLLNYPDELLIFSGLLTFIIYLRHISNIKRLLSGVEPKIGEKK